MLHKSTIVALHNRALIHSHPPFKKGTSILLLATAVCCTGNEQEQMNILALIFAGLALVSIVGLYKLLVESLREKDATDTLPRYSNRMSLEIQVPPPAYTIEAVDSFEPVVGEEPSLDLVVQK